MSAGDRPRAEASSTVTGALSPTGSQCSAVSPT